MADLPVQIQILTSRYYTFVDVYVCDYGLPEHSKWMLPCRRLVNGNADFIASLI